MQHNSAASTSKTNDAFLVVEDNLFDQERITRILTRDHRDVQIFYAVTLKAARRVLASENISMILLDNNLPDGLGSNFVLELTEDPAFSRIPVIMITDWPSPFMWDKAQSAGVAYVLNKSEFHSGYVQAGLTKSRKMSGAPTSGATKSNAGVGQKKAPPTRAGHR